MGEMDTGAMYAELRQRELEGRIKRMEQSGSVYDIEAIKRAAGKPDDAEELLADIWRTMMRLDDEITRLRMAVVVLLRRQRVRLVP